jgi:hypothetical protein
MQLVDFCIINQRAYPRPPRMFPHLQPSASASVTP